MKLKAWGKFLTGSEFAVVPVGAWLCRLRSNEAGTTGGWLRCAAAAVGGAGGQRVSEEKCLTQLNEKFFFNDKPSGLHGNSVYVQLWWSRKKNLTNFKNVSSFMTNFFLNPSTETESLKKWFCVGETFGAWLGRPSGLFYG